ncbi:MAG: Arc family DNA-binding protein [Anaerovoracaceae bacterium]
MEVEIKAREKKLQESEKKKKQILLRIAPSLWTDIARWAEDDFRSINGQIEYLLAECVKKRNK